MKRRTARELKRRFPREFYRSDRLKEIVDQTTDDEREVLGQMVLHYDDVMRRVAKHPDRAGVAAGVHDAIDNAMNVVLTRHPKRGDIQCRKGCSHCCRMNVDVSQSEAKLLLVFAGAFSIAIDQDRLRKQAQGYQGLAPEDRACVFLDAQGACSVYEHRPGACRKHLVVSDSDLCDTVKHPGGKVAGVASAEAEVIWSVMLSREDRGSMAVMLLKELG